MTDTQITKKEEQHMQRAHAPDTDTICLPDVDIVEAGDCIRLVADMPGVDRGSVDVSVENGVLTIEGNGHSAGPEGCELVGQEYCTGKYRRDFTLSDAVDTTGIKARVRRGVLEVTLPVREEAKTRKIEIEA